LAVAPREVLAAWVGTVWIVPQCWQRQTPPAKASSIVNSVWQFVQISEIMAYSEMAAHIGVLNPIARITHHPARASNIANAPEAIHAIEMTQRTIDPLCIAQRPISAAPMSRRTIP
jgi:hypothetical protein